MTTLFPDDAFTVLACLLTAFLAPDPAFAQGSGETGATGAMQTVRPLRLLNLNPLHGAEMSLPEGGVGILAAGHREWSLSLDGASYFSEQESDGDHAIIDGETYRPALTLRRGLGRGWEFSVEAPLVMHRSGLFDRFIEQWHEFFGLPQGGRDQAPRNRLLVSYSRNGSELVRLTDGVTALGDLALGFGYRLPVAPAWTDGMALRGAVRLPTGDADRLAGSGKIGATTMLVTSGALPWAVDTRRWLFSAGIGAMFGASPDWLPESGARPAVLGHLGLAWNLAHRLRVGAQINAQTARHVNARLPMFRDPTVLLGVGIAARVSDTSEIEITVVEDDGVHRAGTDIGLRLTWRWRRTVASDAMSAMLPGG